ncbi:bifunctional diaminohydroxyphosphoribosylaminopyrimidine deaminase/5-amino-6-(5-phosphoribosylamino)uracil reductase RibD [Rhizobium rhizoryzae]|uniref:Riboflavin biosynthesis protein RibD n=1 Tax=Rhizobium rhizoryzae TaxID=451876 RepID=A0A7W6PPI0_9HYPH|nr:bifunctional diaminohydroxyphosphoribosylaminopyrimidine deaminase/5-amino-6-(5-phosphoribosylamino)uracil reductase RibD [Rhizobium rhizoryzae]MBB4142528.1 diaminohydroxyphosphoribosylaminopyrimidine deaminase/5-amino-6-(5-phosphoribosylamino)uracil reductase [Rhizobium rhizoryzae]
MSASPDDERYMAQAIALSRTHTGQTGTNPSVGCLIVKNGVVIGSAVTAVGGRPHAETQALAMAGEAARGAVAYVTLEPCSHYGRTPPCANALVEAGIARVVVGLKDPDPRVSGKGLAILQSAGIEVVTGVLQGQSCDALRAYLMRQMKARPYVTLKLAVSTDGMIGRRGEGQVAITGPLSRQEVHRMRAEMDGILVGIGTAIADDPQLDVRIAGLEHRSPIRIVLDRHLRLPLDGKLVASAQQIPVIAVGDRFAETAPALTNAGVEILDVPDLPTLLTLLADRGLSSVLVEGGATVAKAFLDAGLVDRIVLFEGPSAIGEGGIESPLTHDDIPQDYKPVRRLNFGPDQCCEYERKFECSQAS